MKILDRYILSEWLKIFMLTLLVTVGISVIADIQESLSDFTNDDAPLLEALKYYIIRVPTFLPAIFPITLLISVLFSLGSLHKNNEIIAFQSTGLSIFRITRILWLAGIILACILFYLNAKLVPWCTETSRVIRENVEFESERKKNIAETNIGIIENLGYRNLKENRLWLMNRFSQSSYRGFGVVVYCLNEQGQETRRLMANEVIFDDINNEWTFLRGRELISHPEDGEITPDINRPFEKQTETAFNEEPSVMILQSKRPSALSIFEIENIIDSSSTSKDPRLNAYKVRYHRIISAPLICLVVLAISIPFAVSGVRTNPLVGVSKSMGLFIMYYLLVSLCDVLGERQYLTPIIAAWLPNLAMFLFGISLYRKVR